MSLAGTRGIDREEELQNCRLRRRGPHKKTAKKQLANLNWFWLANLSWPIHSSPTPTGWYWVTKCRGAAPGTPIPGAKEIIGWPGLNCCRLISAWRDYYNRINL